MQHLKAAHKGYEGLTNANGTLQQNITAFLSVDKNDSLNKWANWIVMKFLPISFCEDPHTRACTKLPRVSRRTLKVHMFAVMKTVEEYIRKHLPYSFGLVFDGWTTAGVHYVDLFAVFTATDSLPEGRVLLALSPLEDESDLSAQSMSDFFADTLCEFSRPWASVLFVVGDNCSVNQYLGDNGDIPFVGCGSHRYNLAVQMFLEDHKYLINKANKLMLKFSTVKGRARLASVTGVHPKIKNKTHWSSTMKMLKRCDKLIPALRRLRTKNAVKCGVDKLMLSATEAMEVSELLKDLRKLDSVTVELQSEALTMLDARELFEHTIESFPTMKKYLSANASIVNNAVFERAVVKLQSGRKLTAAEKAASVRLLSPISNDLATNGDKERSDDEDNISFAQQALKRRRLTGPKETYIDTSFIPPTSNICERLFSQSKLFLTDQRRAMRPATLGMLGFLKANRSLW